jgi:hypothetical protein
VTSKRPGWWLMRMRHFLAAQRSGRGSHSRKSFSTIRKAAGSITQPNQAAITLSDRTTLDFASSTFRFSTRRPCHFRCCSRARVVDTMSSKSPDSPFTSVGGQRRTSRKIGGFVVTFVVTAPFFWLTCSSFTYEKRRGRESNPRIAVLQTATLPLGYPAIFARWQLRSVLHKCQRGGDE